MFRVGMPALEGIYACRLEKSWVIRLMRADRRGPTRSHELNTQFPLFRYGLCVPQRSGHNRGDTWEDESDGASRCRFISFALSRHSRDV